MWCSRRRALATVLALIICPAPTLWGAEDRDTGAMSNDVIVTEFRGRPPFKRHRVSSEEVAELARFEETTSRPPGDRVRVAEFRGRPPFKRQILSADEVADLARFEEMSPTSDSQPTRHGPPGKLTSRR